MTPLKGIIVFPKGLTVTGADSDTICFGYPCNFSIAEIIKFIKNNVTHQTEVTLILTPDVREVSSYSSDKMPLSVKTIHVVNYVSSMTTHLSMGVMAYLACSAAESSVSLFYQEKIPKHQGFQISETEREGMVEMQRKIAEKNGTLNAIGYHVVIAWIGPSDYDLHCKYKEGHIYFSNKNEEKKETAPVWLDQDDQAGLDSGDTLHVENLIGTKLLQDAAPVTFYIENFRKRGNGKEPCHYFVIYNQRLLKFGKVDIRESKERKVIWSGEVTEGMKGTLDKAVNVSTKNGYQKVSNESLLRMMVGIPGHKTVFDQLLNSLEDDSCKHWKRRYRKLAMATKIASAYQQNQEVGKMTATNMLRWALGKRVISSVITKSMVSLGKRASKLGTTLDFAETFTRTIQKEINTEDNKHKSALSLEDLLDLEEFCLEAKDCLNQQASQNDAMVLLKTVPILGYSCHVDDTRAYVDPFDFNGINEIHPDMLSYGDLSSGNVTLYVADTKNNITRNAIVPTIETLGGKQNFQNMLPIIKMIVSAILRGTPVERMPNDVTAYLTGVAINLLSLKSRSTWQEKILQDVIHTIKFIYTAKDFDASVGIGKAFASLLVSPTSVSFTIPQVYITDIWKRLHLWRKKIDIDLEKMKMDFSSFLYGSVPVYKTIHDRVKIDDGITQQVINLVQQSSLMKVLPIAKMHTLYQTFGMNEDNLLLYSSFGVLRFIFNDKESLQMTNFLEDLVHQHHLFKLQKTITSNIINDLTVKKQEYSKEVNTLPYADFLIRVKQGIELSYPIKKFEFLRKEQQNQITNCCCFTNRLLLKFLTSDCDKYQWKAWYLNFGTEYKERESIDPKEVPLKYPLNRNFPGEGTIHEHAMEFIEKICFYRIYTYRSSNKPNRHKHCNSNPSNDAKHHKDQIERSRRMNPRDEMYTPS